MRFFHPFRVKIESSSAGRDSVNSRFPTTIASAQHLVGNFEPIAAKLDWSRWSARREGVLAINRVDKSDHSACECQEQRDAKEVHVCFPGKSLSLGSDSLRPWHVVTNEWEHLLALHLRQIHSNRSRGAA